MRSAAWVVAGVLAVAAGYVWYTVEPALLVVPALLALGAIVGNRPGVWRR